MSTEIEWRRRWKPDLKACPWQSIKIDDTLYLIKTKFTQNSYELLLTDMTSFWYEELSDVSVEKRIKKLNPNIEAPVTRILDQIKNCLESPDKGTNICAAFKPDGDSGEEKILLSISSELAGMPFSWHFTGRPADKSMTSEHLIVPLMTMLAEMMRRQQELIHVIQAKDKEIDDYKSQGVKTSRKHIETNPFVETAFENDMLLSKGFEKELSRRGSSAFSEAGQDLYRQIMSKSAWLHRSPRKAGDDGDSLLDESSLSQRKPSSAASWDNNRLPPSMTGSKSVSPQKSPRSSASKSPQDSPVKTSEMLRQKALERRIEEEEMKKQDKAKKKKKIAF